MFFKKKKMLCYISFSWPVSCFIRAKHLYLRENIKEHSRLIKYWSNFDVLSKVFAQKLYFLPHFLGFHAISRVFTYFCDKYSKLGHIYKIKSGSQLVPTIFRTPSTLSNMGSQGSKI